jgi:hypothetical protein
MPYTAKLSQLFYEKLGEQVANELVDWFNAVDTTYRGELKELNETNFARFDAKLEQRLAQVQTHLESRIDRKLDSEVATHAFAQLNSRLDRIVAEWDAKLERRLGEQTRWLLLAWGTLFAAIIGLWVRG